VAGSGVVPDLVLDGIAGLLAGDGGR
jgi:hypothetical protein